MPRNSRPGGLFGDMDYGWKGTTLNERIQAQNQWDLLAAQERANELKEEELRQNREFQEEREYHNQTILDLERENRQLRDCLNAYRKQLDDRIEMIEVNKALAESYQALREKMIEHDKKYDIHIQKMLKKHRGMKVTGCKTFITAETEIVKQKAIQKAKEIEEQKAIEEMRKEITREVTLKYEPLKIAVEQIYDLKSEEEVKAFKKADATSVYNQYRERGLYLQNVCTLLGFISAIIGLIFGILYFIDSFALLSAMVLAFTIDTVLWCSMQGIGKAIARYFEKIAEDKRDKIIANNNRGCAIRAKLQDIHWGLINDKEIVLSKTQHMDYGVIQKAINEEIEERMNKALSNIPHITKSEDSK